MKIKTDFIDNTTISVCRSILVDWLIHIHNALKLKIETLYLGIKILDEYLQVRFTTILIKLEFNIIFKIPKV